MLFAVCGCEFGSISPISEPSSSSEPSNELITLSEHEVSLITDESTTVTFTVENYRGDVQMSVSNPEICSVVLKRRAIEITALTVGQCAITLTAGSASDDIVVYGIERTLYFFDHDYEVHINNAVEIPFESNGDYSNLKTEVIDKTDSSASVNVSILKEDRVVRVYCSKKCSFKLKLYSHEAYDVTTVRYYIAEWPYAEKSYDCQILVIRNRSNRTPEDICCKFMFDDARQDVEYMLTSSSGVSGGYFQQYGEKDGKYYFCAPVFDFESSDEYDRFFVVDFVTKEIWVKYTFPDGYVAEFYGESYEPFYFLLPTEATDITFFGHTVSKGEVVTFSADPVCSGRADFFPYYTVYSEEHYEYEELAPFRRQVKFLHTGTYLIIAHDFVSNLTKEVTYTVI